MQPTASVVIPAYNAAATIRATIESVLRQTYRDFEILVIDDGSTDETASVVHSFGSDVRYLSQPNQGLAAARNAGIRATGAPVLALLDADDMWLPEVLERQVAILAAQPAVDGVYAWAQFIDEHGSPLPDQMRTQLDGDILRRLLLGGNSILFSMLAIRRSVFHRVGLFDPSFRQAQDWDITLRMAAAGIKFACIPQPLVLRRLHADNLSADPDRSLRWDRAVLDKAFATLPMAEHHKALADRAHFNVLHRAAMSHWRRGAREAAITRLVEAAVLWPGGLRRPQTYITSLYRLRPSGHRTKREILGELDTVGDELARLLRAVLAAAGSMPAVRRTRRRAWSAFHAALAMCFAQNHRWHRAIGHAVKSLALRPGLVLDVGASLLHARTQHLRSNAAPVRRHLQTRRRGSSNSVRGNQW